MHCWQDFVICVDLFMIIELQYLSTLPILEFDNIGWQSSKVLLSWKQQVFPFQSMHWNVHFCVGIRKSASINLNQNLETCSYRLLVPCPIVQNFKLLAQEWYCCISNATYPPRQVCIGHRSIYIVVYFKFLLEKWRWEELNSRPQGTKSFNTMSWTNNPMWMVLYYNSYDVIPLMLSHFVYYWFQETIIGRNN